MADAEEQQKKTTKSIAGRISEVVLSTPGVDRLSGRVFAGPGKKREDKQPANSVRITVKDEGIRVDVHIVVCFGKAIPEISRRIQKDTKDLLEREYSKFALSAVNVQVDGVRFDQGSAAYRRQAVEALEELRGRSEEYDIEYL